MTPDSNSIKPRLMDQVALSKDGLVATQKARIGQKVINISLHFDRKITRGEAARQMQLSLGKVATLQIPSDTKTTAAETEIHLYAFGQIEKIQELGKSHIPEPLRFEFTFLSGPVLAAEPTPPETNGKVLRDRFTLPNGKSAEEKALRADTVVFLGKNLETQIAHLTKKLEQDPNNKDIKTLLERSKKELAALNATKGNATWGSTNTPRFAFINLGRQRTKELYAPIACNLRMQTVKDPEGNVVSAVTRSAALSDFSHGEVSLQELKDLGDLEKWTQLTPERQSQLGKLYLTQGAKTKTPEEVVTEIKIKTLVGYGLENLVELPGKYHQLHNILKKLQSVDSIPRALQKMSPSELKALAEIPFDASKFSALIQERSLRLKLMALQDLQLHFETRPARTDPVLYCRTSIVDMQKTSKNDLGLVLDEKTQGLDMKALFDELDGASLLFDCEEGETAFIDEEGKIHLPPTCASGIKESQLSTAFFNICSQGPPERTLNSGMQAAINSEALEKLERMFSDTPEFVKLKEAFQKLTNNPEYDANHAVVAATQFMQKQKGYTGINCYGGKDRTGYATALVTYQCLLDMSHLPSDSPEAETWRRQLLSKEGIAGQSAGQNTNVTILKLTRIDLTLYDTSTLKGKMLRGAHAASGLVNGAKKMLKDTLHLDSLSISDTEGQLYKKPTFKATHLSSFDGIRKIKTLVRRFKH